MNENVIDSFVYLNDDDHQFEENPLFLELLEALEKEIDLEPFRPKVNRRVIERCLGASFLPNICQEVVRVGNIKILQKTTKKIDKDKAVKLKTKSDLEKAIKSDISKMFSKNTFKTISSSFESQLKDQIELAILFQYEALEEAHPLNGFSKDRMKENQFDISLFKIFFFLSFKSVYECSSATFKNSLISKEKDAFCEYVIEKLLSAFSKISNSKRYLNITDLMNSIVDYNYKGKDIYMQIDKEIKSQRIIIHNNKVKIPLR